MRGGALRKLPGHVCDCQVRKATGLRISVANRGIKGVGGKDEKKGGKTEEDVEVKVEWLLLEYKSLLFYSSLR